MLISKLKALLQDSAIESETTQQPQRLASAALLVEVARADFDASADEQDALIKHLRSAFALSAEELEILLETAERQVDNTASLYEFTRVINDSCTPKQRETLIEAMWQVAYADGELHKYEEHLIRRVADLLYVPHHAFIATKHRARDNL